MRRAMRSNRRTWAVLGLCLPAMGCNSPAGNAGLLGAGAGLLTGAATYALTGSARKAVAVGAATGMVVGVGAYMWQKRQARMEEQRTAEERFYRLQQQNAQLQTELAQTRAQAALVPVERTQEQTVFVEVDPRTGQAGSVAHTLPNDQADGLAQQAAQGGGRTTVRMDDSEYVVLMDEFATA